MIVYPGSIDDSHQLIQFFRREQTKLKILRWIVVSRESTVVLDVNRDGIEFAGLTFDSPVLPRLLEELGVVCDLTSLVEPPSSPDGVKEFGLGAVWTWGHG